MYESSTALRDVPSFAKDCQHQQTSDPKNDEELRKLKNNDHDITRKSSAAVLIQRRVRGMGARVSVRKRKESLICENEFAKTLNPLLSPAENAANALLDLATVMTSIDWTSAILNF